MELTDISRFLGFEKKNDMFETIVLNKEFICKEIVSKTSLDVLDFDFFEFYKIQSLFGFTVCYPVEINRASFLSERKIAKNYSFSFLSGELSQVLRVKRCEVKLFNIQYKYQRLYYHFVILGVDSKTDKILSLFA